MEVRGVSQQSQLSTTEQGSREQSRVQAGVESCVPNFFNRVILPDIPAPADEPGVVGRVVNHITGIPDFLRTFRSEACDGKVGQDSVRSLTKAVAKTGLVAVGAGAVVTTGVLGGLAASAVGVAGGLVLGGALVFGVGPKLVDSAVDSVFSGLGNIGGRFKEYREEKQGLR